MIRHTCDHCGVPLTVHNTSPASAAKELCQECYHEGVEAGVIKA